MPKNRTTARPRLLARQAATTIEQGTQTDYLTELGHLGEEELVSPDYTPPSTPPGAVELPADEPADVPPTDAPTEEPTEAKEREVISEDILGYGVHSDSPEYTDEDDLGEADQNPPIVLENQGRRVSWRLFGGIRLSMEDRVHYVTQHPYRAVVDGHRFVRLREDDRFLVQQYRINWMMADAPPHRLRATWVEPEQIYAMQEATRNAMTLYRRGHRAELRQRRHRYRHETVLSLRRETRLVQFPPARIAVSEDELEEVD